MSYIPRCEKDCITPHDSSYDSENELSLAMAYIPDQKWRKIYSGDVALKRGTMFCELDKPFIGEEAVCNG